MRHTSRLTIPVALFLSGVLHAATLTLVPAGGAITGAPGATIGWGFQLTNTTDYLLVTGAAFQPAAPLVGAFTDYTASQSIVVGPAPESPSVSEAFNSATHTGVGAFQIAAGAHAGDSASGQIVLTYNLFRHSPNDPAFNPDVDLVSRGNQLSAAASVSVTAGALVPEPGPAVLIGLGLLLLSSTAVRRRLES